MLTAHAARRITQMSYFSLSLVKHLSDSLERYWDEVRRIYLPRTPVKKGRKKGRIRPWPIVI
jgi:hypothetical protein